MSAVNNSNSVQPNDWSKGNEKLLILGAGITLIALSAVGFYLASTLSTHMGQGITSAFAGATATVGALLCLSAYLMHKGKDPMKVINRLIHLMGGPHQNPTIKKIQKVLLALTFFGCALWAMTTLRHSTLSGSLVVGGVSGLYVALGALFAKHLLEKQEEVELQPPVSKELVSSS